MKIRHAVFAMAIAALAAPATAGSLSDPIVAPQVIIEDAVESSVGAQTFVLLMSIVVLTAAIAD